MTEQHLILFDASGFAFRAYYAFSPRYRPSDGMPTGAILGFMSILWRSIGAAQADKPTHGAAVFDAKGTTFRKQIFPKYKANRPIARREELDIQFPYLRHAADAMGLTPVECNGFEADDVIATLADRAIKAGMRVTIVSSDKDFAQMVEDGRIEIVDPVQKVRKLAADVREKFHVDPPLVQHVQALAGDAIDGIPGIPGVGIQKAATLVRRFGTVSDVLKNADKAPWPSVRVALKRHGKDALTYLKLTTLRRDAPVEIELDDLALQPAVRSHLVDMLRILEAGDRMESIFTQDYHTVRVVPHIDNPYEWWEEELKAPGQTIPDIPQCGFYQRRLAPAPAPFVPAKIWRVPQTDPVTEELTGNDLLQCMVGYKPRDPVAEWTRLSMNPISRKDYGYERADAEHAKAYRPNDPKASPEKTINILEHKAPRNPKPLPKRRKKS